MLLPVRHSIVQCGPSTAAMPARFTRLVQEIGKGHDSDRLTGIDDYQTPDRMASHQVRSLVNGGPGSDGRRDPGVPVGQRLPVHGLQEDHGGRSAGRRVAEGGLVMTT